MTGSDDDKDKLSAPDELVYYEVTNNSGKWYFDDFYGCKNEVFISEVHGLHQYCAAPVPEPGTLFLLGAGLLGVVPYKRRFRRSGR